jgi:hypothetical protein
MFYASSSDCPRRPPGCARATIRPKIRLRRNLSKWLRRRRRPLTMSIFADDCPQPQANLKSQFCNECGKLDIGIHRFLGRAPPHQPVILSSLQCMQERKHCPLCRLISAACLNGPLQRCFLSTKRGVPCGLVSSWEVAVEPRKEKYSQDLTHCLVLRLTAHDLHEPAGKIVIRPISRSCQEPHFARFVDQPVLDIPMLKSWLSQCESDHFHGDP